MTGAALALIAASVFITAVISGVFGMAGGMILMVILLQVMPVAAAMILHACIQLVSNAWRCWLWRRHIVWRVIPPYLAGIAAGIALISLVRYVPDKAYALLMMGSLPLLAMAGAKYVRLDALNRLHTFATAVLLTFVQMTAGVVGALLDLLYINAPFTRQQIVSTKAFTQGTMHLVRIIYFGMLIPLLVPGHSVWPEDVGYTELALFAGLAIAGTSAAALLLKRMNDENFKNLSRYLIILISSYCIGQGIYLLAKA